MTNRPDIPTRRGFTLIELLVSVAILVIMLMAFGKIISQTQSLVTGCQQIMRMNTLASVTAQLLQRDLVSLSKDAPLTLGTDQLTFARVTSNTSVDPAVAPAVTANAAMVYYGRNTGKILYRQAMLFTPGQTTGAADAVNCNLDTAPPAPTIAVPLDTNTPITSATTYWAYLAGGCTKFTTGSWDGTTWSPGSFIPNTPTILTNLTNWPNAIRVAFTLQDGEQTQNYELLIDLP